MLSELFRLDCAQFLHEIFIFFAVDGVVVVRVLSALLVALALRRVQLMSGFLPVFVSVNLPKTVLLVRMEAAAYLCIVFVHRSNATDCVLVCVIYFVAAQKLA